MVYTLPISVTATWFLSQMLGQKVVENPKKQYFSYVKRANVTKILRVWTFQKFKYFGLDQMFQTNYFLTRHHLVIYL